MGVVQEGVIDGMQLPPDYTVSQWADMHIVLPEGMASEPGRWRSSRAPYQREMMNVLADPTVRQVILMTSAQIGKTLVLIVGIGYYIHHRPSPMIMIQPTLEMGEAFSKDKLDPIIRESEVLAERVAGEKSRTSSNTMRYKAFPGGFLAITGANSPTSLRMRSVRIVWADEVDAYPPVAGNEGDPLKLAMKRSMTFWDAKLVACSTPTVKGLSRIDGLYEKSDQRKLHVCCPECDAEQALEWEFVVWDKGKPETARYVCQGCGSLLTDGQIKAACLKGVWIAAKPSVGIVGFAIWQIYSPFSSMPLIVAEFEDAQGKPAEEQVFWNTVLGRAWDGDLAANVTVAALLKRRETYAVSPLPERAVVVTAGVDVQADRIEVLFRAFGPENESWAVHMAKIYGDPAGNAPWAELEEMLLTRFPHPSGRTLQVEAAAIDSGFLAQKVYDFANKHFQVGRRWHAIKGVSGEARPAWMQSEQRIKGGARLFIVGIDAMKTEEYSRLATEEHGKDYTHFPHRDAFDEAWFEQLIVEKVRIVYNTSGQPKREWFKPPGKRNEALDLMVYASAAHRSLNINHIQRLEAFYQPKQSTSAADIAKLFRR